MGKILVVKVKEKGGGGFEYKNKVSLQDPSLIALIFEDLENIFNAPVKKACKIILERDKNFPF